MKKSKIVKGDIEEIEEKIDELINNGYKVHSFIHDESAYFYALLIKE